MIRTQRNRHLRSALGSALVALLAISTAAAAQDASPQALYEAGQYDAVLARVDAERGAGRESLESAFMAAQAARRLGQGDRVVQEYERLASSPNPAWAALGRAGAALERGDLDQAQGAAGEAIGLEGGLGFAHYQLGMVHARRNNHEAAGQAFARAAELMPSFAYAHYYAGLSFQRVKNINRMATHFEQFVQLAPNAPERTQVLVVLRSVRG
ncbi:MAG: hypothetical protein Q8L86_14425 [Vicinamibacterales bacterium]|nr:hypothetical protein [Vicinamibacterales bacterium]